MTLYKEWENLMKNQTDESFPNFWKEYSEGEKQIYSHILDNWDKGFSGVFSELYSKHEVSPVIFMGFLDGIQSSLKKEINLKKIDDNSEITLDIDFEKLFFNMFVAEANYLYTLPQWENILGKEKMEEIEKNYKRSKTIVKDEKIGRNEPCPCGSGKKYKHCCGRN